MSATDKELLVDLMNISPIIDNRISELTTSSMQVDFDPVLSIPSLIRDGVSELIDLLAGVGIDFYADDDELLPDRHNIDYIITLYEQFAPDNIRHLLCDQTLIDNINSAVDGVSDEEFIIKVLEATRDTYATDYYNQMYNFLHDKMSSTRIYSSAITEIIRHIETNNDYTSDVVITEVEIAFIAKLMGERKWYLTTLMNLIHNYKFGDYQDGVRLSSQFCTGYCIPSNASILANFIEYSESNKDIVDNVLKRIRKQSPFYVDHYTDAELVALDINLVIGIIMAQLSDKRLFDITPDFKRLISQSRASLPVIDIIKAIPIQNKIQ